VVYVLLVHAVKYTIVVAKKFIVIAKKIIHYHPSMDAIKNG